MQRNWIGRSHGARVVFRLEGDDGVELPVFTTRPDTLFGATFFVMAPEHPLVLEMARGTEHEAAVADYVRHSAALSTVERASEKQSRPGVFTGRYVINPVNGERVPIWVADYVLMEYGTGAIMAVPAHDDRDFDFAHQFGLEIRPVIRPGDGRARPEHGPYAGDRPTTSCSSTPAGSTACARPTRRRRSSPGWTRRVAARARSPTACATGCCRASATGAARSRSSTATTCGMVPVPDDQLPVVLPDISDYAPRGRSPLAAAEDWVKTTCPTCGGEARRETDTMDTFVDSSWYYMRYADPLNDQAPFDREVVDAWLPVDQYIGGIEHAVLHLLYARFFTKALYDLGYVGFTEPFANLFTQGMIYYQGAKMAKSRGNVISPDDMVGPVRRRHRPAVLAVSGAAGSGRRVVRRGRRRCAPVRGAAVAAGERVGGRDRPRACPTPPRPTGRARRWCERPTGRSTRSPPTSAAGLPSTRPSRRCTSWWATSKTRRRRRPSSGVSRSPRRCR